MGHSIDQGASVRALQETDGPGTTSIMAEDTFRTDGDQAEVSSEKTNTLQDKWSS